MKPLPPNNGPLHAFPIIRPRLKVEFAEAYRNKGDELNPYWVPIVKIKFSPSIDPNRKFSKPARGEKVYDYEKQQLWQLNATEAAKLLSYLRQKTDAVDPGAKGDRNTFVHIEQSSNLSKKLSFSFQQEKGNYFLSYKGPNGENFGTGVSIDEATLLEEFLAGAIRHLTQIGNNAREQSEENFDVVATE